MLSNFIEFLKQWFQTTKFVLIHLYSFILTEKIVFVHLQTENRKQLQSSVGKQKFLERAKSKTRISKPVSWCVCDL